MGSRGKDGPVTSDRRKSRAIIARCELLLTTICLSSIGLPSLLWLKILSLALPIILASTHPFMPKNIKLAKMDQKMRNKNKRIQVRFYFRSMTRTDLKMSMDQTANSNEN
jgi:hypothetical protein